MKCSAPPTSIINQFRKQYAASLTNKKTAAKQVETINNITAHRWHKGQSGNYAGRPKKLNTLLIEQGYSQSSINDCICAMLAMNEAQLKTIEHEPEATMLERTIAAALLRSFNRCNLYALEVLLTRRFGKPKETADINQAINGSVSISLDLT